MKTTRLEAFSDGVIAIIITIMVLDFKVPAEHSVAALLGLWPTFLSYGVSFLIVAIYWVNHHHLIHLARRVDAAVLWANLNLLFWLSLVPFTTAYHSANTSMPLAVALYGVNATVCAVSFYFLRHAIARQSADDPHLIRLHAAMQRKNLLAITIYVAAVGLAWVQPWLGLVVIMAPAAMYFIPDRQVERALHD